MFNDLSSHCSKNSVKFACIPLLHYNKVLCFFCAMLCYFVLFCAIFMLFCAIFMQYKQLSQIPEKGSVPVAKARKKAKIFDVKRFLNIIPPYLVFHMDITKKQSCSSYRLSPDDQQRKN